LLIFISILTDLRNAELPMQKNISIKNTLTRYLDTHATPYEIIKNRIVRDSDEPNGDVIASTSVAKPVIVRNATAYDGNNFIMTLIPVNHALNLDVLGKLSHCKITTVPAHDYVAFVKNWAPGMFSPIAEEYGIKTLIDNQLCQRDTIFFKTENNKEFIKLKLDVFRQLHKTTIFGHQFSSPLSAPGSAATNSSSKNKQSTEPTQRPGRAETLSIRQRIERITELPPMPEMAKKIIHLNANPYARAEDLATLVEFDPSLSAQIMRYAKSPFFGYQGKINSVQQAVSRVLGYDMVMNIALGLAATSSFKIPKKGPLGLDAFWKHSIYSATLTQMIGKLMHKNAQPQAGIAYLSGLLHNFGFLLLGHLFKDEFMKLNKAIIDNPDKSVIALEQEILRVEHTEIGAWLMQAWNMPTEVITTIREHHNEEYSGINEQYVNLILIADRLLKSKDIGDVETAELPRPILEKYGISEDQLNNCLENLIEGSSELDSIANTLAA